MQFRAAADGFLRACAIERQLSRHTVQAYACDLSDFGRWLPAALPVAEVSIDLVKGYLAEMVDARKLALATVRRRLACVAHPRASFLTLPCFKIMAFDRLILKSGEVLDY
jgi:integrase/recombinase XerD